jgi:hypothetical protein
MVLRHREPTRKPAHISMTRVAHSSRVITEPADYTFQPIKPSNRKIMTPTLTNDSPYQRFRRS